MENKKIILHKITYNVSFDALEAHLLSIVNNIESPNSAIEYAKDFIHNQAKKWKAPKGYSYGYIKEDIQIMLERIYDSSYGDEEWVFYCILEATETDDGQKARLKAERKSIDDELKTLTDRIKELAELKKKYE